MTINLTGPGSASPTGALFYDPGTRGATGTMTKVAGVPVKAAVEIQSTEGGFLLPRMTSAQRIALTPIVDGMEVYDTTVLDIFTRKNSTWVQEAPLSGFLYSTGVLTAANIRNMHGAAQLILNPAGPNLMYVVHGFQLSTLYGAVFTAGGNTFLQYGNVADSGRNATAAISATLLTNAFSDNYYVTGACINGPTAQVNNAALTITNDTAAFAGGGATTVTWKVWYSVVAVAV